MTKKLKEEYEIDGSDYMEQPPQQLTRLVLIYDFLANILTVSQIFIITSIDTVLQSKHWHVPTNAYINQGNY